MIPKRNIGGNSVIKLTQLLHNPLTVLSDKDLYSSIIEDAQGVMRKENQYEASLFVISVTLLSPSFGKAETSYDTLATQVAKLRQKYKL